MNTFAISNLKGELAFCLFLAIKSTQLPTAGNFPFIFDSIPSSVISTLLIALNAVPLALEVTVDE
ncbi:hypothetical protein D3C87_1361070 [compost metagenome]